MLDRFAVNYLLLRIQDTNFVALCRPVNSDEVSVLLSQANLLVQPVRDAASALYWRFARELPTGRASRTAPAGRTSPPGAVSQGAIGTPSGVVGSLLVIPVRIWFQGYRGRAEST